MIKNSSPLLEKANHFQRDLTEKHLLEGLYVSIVSAASKGGKHQHTVDEPGNVIHAGVWTGRYLAGVGYQYAVTRDPKVRKHGGEILRGLRTLQEVTGKPGLLARGFVKGHGPVEGWERGGADSIEWHQGRGKYSDYRWYGDVSVDNFNAVLYGYSVYYDLAADDAQKRFIARDVDRLMTHLVDHRCRIVDVDGEVTRWGHVGIDPGVDRDDYYRDHYGPLLARYGLADAPWRPPLHSSLMLLPDLLIADRITGKPKYRKLYRRVVDRFRDNSNPFRDSRPFSLERVAKVNHSSEGQDYEALYNLIRYERNPELLDRYREWTSDLWEMNWMEGNALYTFMSLALLPDYRPPSSPGSRGLDRPKVSHAKESLALAAETLRRFPVDRVFRPVMNSLRPEIERNPLTDRTGDLQTCAPLPIDERPLDNEYEWKASPYRMDGWLRPTVTSYQISCDDPEVAWFSDSTGRVYGTLDGGATWTDRSVAMMGASVVGLRASRCRTFVLFAKSDSGVLVTRDGGLSWREARAEETPQFSSPAFDDWLGTGKVRMRIDSNGCLEASRDGGETVEPSMYGWRIPLAKSLFVTPSGFLASGPGGAYVSRNGRKWTELKLWVEEETGAADFVHAYWMGRYYGFLQTPRK